MPSPVTFWRQQRPRRAGQWRGALLLSRQQRNGRQAKQAADDLAREIIARSGAPKPTSLRHDAAEAILLGWWALSADLLL